MKLNENFLLMYWKYILVLCCFLAVGDLAAMEFEKKDREAVIFSQRVEIVVRDGRIVHLKSRKSGTVFADRSLAEPSVTAGLGCMLGKDKELSRLHFPWGEPGMNQHVQINGTDLYHRPTAQSAFEVKRSGKEIVTVWKGLSDGKSFFPDESISIHFGEDARGSLTFQGRGESARGGVFAVQIPVENIVQNSTFLLPTFGGLEYGGKGTRALMTFQDTVQFYEAPVMICGVGNDTFSLWSEDETFRPFFAFFARDWNSCSFAFEFQNLIPYEPLKKTESNLVKLDVFDGCDWVEAARPYRDWYQKTFAEEIAARDSIEWANQISVIVDGGSQNKKALELIRSLLPPERVLFHEWQARKEGFTTNMPDYTPKEAYPGNVANLHAHGFRVMCYTCALCASYQSPVWKRDGVGDFLMPRRTSITNYKGGKSAFDENLVGNLTSSSDARNPFINVNPGYLIYGDPLSSGWRDYYTNIIRKFNELTGTDANYQDTLGCTADNGNGIVDGLRGAQGNAQLAKDLQKKVGVPMASEFGPAAIGFAVKWPLNYAQVWGGNAFQKSRIHRHRPLTPFLFGYRTWIPVIVADNDFKKHLISAASDALSGMGMFASSEILQNQYGMDGHLLLRAQVFARNELVPFYPERRYPVHIRAMYKGKDGGIFQYYDDGTLQMLLDPQGKPLYGRIDGVSELKRSDLALPGWPVYDEDGVSSLDPGKSYALFPENETVKPRLRVEPLEKDVFLKLYYDADHFLYVEFDGKGKKETEVTLDLPAEMVKATCNDEPLKVSSRMTVRGSLPMRLVFSDGKTTSPDTVRNINLDDGLQSGTSESLPALVKEISGKKMYHVNYYHAKSLDFIMQVNHSEDALEMLLCNEQNQYGNGSSVTLLINGKTVAAFDCLVNNPKWSQGSNEPQKTFDTKLRKWTVPVGQYSGKEILVSVRVDNKLSNNADMQWISIPEIVRDGEQKFREVILDRNKLSPPAAVTHVVRPTGKILGETLPEWPQKEIVRMDGTPDFRYQPVVAHGVLYSSKQEFIDPGKRYFLGCEVRKDGAKKELFFLGVVQYDAAGKEIHGVHINAVPKSDTHLSRPAQKGSVRLMVADASAWKQGAMIALNSDSERKDLPNWNLIGPIKSIQKNDGDWIVELQNPILEDIESDIPVRIHQPTGTHQYVFSGYPQETFQSIGREIKWWPKAVSYRFLMISSQPIIFRNMKIEQYSF